MAIAATAAAATTSVCNWDAEEVAWSYVLIATSSIGLVSVT